MNRRSLILGGLAPLALQACAVNGPPTTSPGGSDPRYPVAGGQAGAAPPPAYTTDELVRAGSNALGVTAEAVGGVIERVARDRGQEATAYIAGEEGSGAVGLGLRYGRGCCT
jgi:hypothetical protein